MKWEILMNQEWTLVSTVDAADPVLCLILIFTCVILFAIFCFTGHVIGILFFCVFVAREHSDG